MSFERSLPGTGIGFEHAAPPPGSAEDGPPPDEPEIPLQLKLQILTTEHWSLLATRALAWNEAFSRAGMFLTTLSGAMVALALVAQAAGFSDTFALFALVVLPIALFVGITTVLRLGAANYNDMLCVKGMNRLRGAYLEMAPDLEKYFVMSAHDDMRGIALTSGVQPTAAVQMLAGTPTLVVVLNATLAGIIGALVTLRAGGGTGLAAGIGGVVFVVTAAAHVFYASGAIAGAARVVRPVFPSPPDDQPAEASPSTRPGPTSPGSDR